MHCLLDCLILRFVCTCYFRNKDGGDQTGSGWQTASHDPGISSVMILIITLLKSHISDYLASSLSDLGVNSQPHRTILPHTRNMMCGQCDGDGSQRSCTHMRASTRELCLFLDQALMLTASDPSQSPWQLSLPRLLSNMPLELTWMMSSWYVDLDVSMGPGPILIYYIPIKRKETWKSNLVPITPWVSCSIFTIL